MLTHELGSGFEISGQGWFTGGVSKIQMGFTLDWTDPVQGARRERLVVRMDPSESLNVTSRAREFELIRLFEGRLPVPKVFWLDPDGRFFPEPALIYAFAEGVTKPRQTATGKVSGLGTVFGPVVGAFVIIAMQTYLAQVGQWVTVIQGGIFVLCVLLFRRVVVRPAGLGEQVSLESVVIGLFIVTLMVTFLAAGSLPPDTLAARVKHRQVVQIHWGGGTPTHLSADQLRHLGEALDTVYSPPRGYEDALRTLERVAIVA